MKQSVRRPASKAAVLALAATLTAWASAAAQATAAAPSTDEAARIDAAVSAFRSKMGVPADTVAIVQDGQIRFQRGYGTAALENSVAATAETVYRMPYMKTALSAVAALQLEDKGKINLDAKIQ